VRWNCIRGCVGLPPSRATTGRSTGVRTDADCHRTRFSGGRTKVGPDQRAQAQNPHEYWGLGIMKKVCKTFMRRFDPDPRLQLFQ